SPSRRDSLFEKGPGAYVILQNPDLTGKDGSIIRSLHLVFILHARLDDLDWKKLQGSKSGSEGGSDLRVETEEVSHRDIEARGGTLSKADAVCPSEWSSHSIVTMYKRLHVETTDRGFATRSAGSVVIASRTDPRFSSKGPAQNVWWPFSFDVQGKRT